MGTASKSKERLKKLRAGYPTRDPETGKVTVRAKAPSTRKAKKAKKEKVDRQAAGTQDSAMIAERLRVEKELGIERGDY